MRVDGVPVHLSQTDWAIDRGRALSGRAQRGGLHRAARRRPRNWPRSAPTVIAAVDADAAGPTAVPAPTAASAPAATPVTPAPAPAATPAYDREPAVDGSRPGPLHGIRVVELAGDQPRSPASSWPGIGAEVVLVEPPGGRPQPWLRAVRRRRPRPRAQPVVVALPAHKHGVCSTSTPATADRARFRTLVAHADVVLEAQPRAGWPPSASTPRPGIPDLAPPTSAPAYAAVWRRHAVRT